MKHLLICTALVCTGFLFAADLKDPAFQMAEKDLLAVVAGTNLNNRITACQELAHTGTAAAVPALAALLTDQTDAPLFHAARYALQNIPGAEADAALATAETRVTGTRRDGIQASRRIRATPVTPGYAGAAAVLTAFPPKTPLQNGDLSVVPALVQQALGKGFEATLARRHLVGFPNKAIDDKLLALAYGSDVAQARLAVGVLGDRRVLPFLPRLGELARTTPHAALRTDIYKSFATLCDADSHLPFLLKLVQENPKEDRLVGTLIRVCTRAFVADDVDVKILVATYGYFGTNTVRDAHNKPIAQPFTDVREMVAELVAAGARSIMSGNRLAGRGGFPADPAPGVHKELRLTYRVGDGPEISVVTPENGETELAGCVLPEKIAVPLLDAYAAATGDVRTALKRVVDTLVKRGRVADPKERLFRPIFNGKNLAGWTQEDVYFTVKDGIITGESVPGHLCQPNHHLVYTAETFTDFELRAEFRLSRSSNSGIQLRCKPQFIGDNGYQADMNGGGDFVGFLYHPRQHLVGERGANVVIAPNGQKTVTRFAADQDLRKRYKMEDWNDIRIVVKGRRIDVWINGTHTTSVTDPREEFFPSRGHIALQLHQGPPMKVEFRNLRVK